MLLALQHFQDTLDPEDEELPTGIHDTLDQLRQKLELIKVRHNTCIYFYTDHDSHRCRKQHTSFSKVDPTILVQVNIKIGPLFLVQDQIGAAKEIESADIDGRAITLDVLKELITLTRKHVSVVVSTTLITISYILKFSVRRRLDAES